jgi:hypothetical protein
LNLSCPPNPRLATLALREYANCYLTYCQHNQHRLYRELIRVTEDVFHEFVQEQQRLPRNIVSTALDESGRLARWDRKRRKVVKVKISRNGGGAA